MSRFRDRRDAGQQLAASLAATHAHRRGDIVVLALPRGGVAIGYEIAARLDAQLDVLVVRKLGVPGDEDVAMGAIASGGAQVLDRDTLTERQIAGDVLQRVIAREQLELRRREKLFRGDHAATDVRGRRAIIVDDGLAAAATVLAACKAVWARLPASVTVALPVANAELCARLRSLVDEVVCLEVPARPRAITGWYSELEVTSDDEVRALLARAARRLPPDPAAPAATAA